MVANIDCDPSPPSSLRDNAIDTRTIGRVETTRVAYSVTSTALEGCWTYVVESTRQ